jgi:WD40 repeat protein
MVMAFAEHQSWILNVELQMGSEHRLISGCADGLIKFWDSRHQQAVRTFDPDPLGPLSALSIHQQAPVFGV